MSAEAQSAQYLTFKLDQELYALEIGKVREVLEFSSVTRVPRMPEFMRGVINLRGNVVPVVDLKLKLGLPATERTIDTCVVIAEVQVDGEATVLGALADSVQEVVELESDQMSPAPHVGTRITADCIRGMGRQDDHFLMLLDIDHVLSADDLQGMTSAGVNA
jgi:purine-binding chemotaxis protein CheW